VLYGIKPAVTAIVVFAAYRIGSRALRNNVLRLMAVLAFIAIFAFGIPFPYIVLAAGFIGYMGSRISPEHFKAGAGHGSSKETYGAAIIDDDTPAPAHAKFNLGRFVTFSLVGLIIGGAVMAMLLNTYGWQGTLTQMSWFFTKAALVTFGGAYAVLPYVYQGGVEQYQWLTGGQMIDGLALGETTPGPLIMVVAFVGFVGGWTKEIFGPDSLFLAGAAGASIATLFTFLPSFLFILLGGPAVEATRDDVKFTAPLTGITAAVVQTLEPVMATCLERDGLFMLHTNEPVGHQYPGKTPNTLRQIYDFVKAYPENRIILAHWGGGLLFYALMKKEVKDVLKNVWFDTAASPFLYTPDIYRIGGEAAGAEKLLFGTDYPLLKPRRYFKEIESAGLSSMAKKQLTGLNAAELLQVW